MLITPNDIDQIETIGTLHGKPVKMVRCKGGFHLALGKKKGKSEDEAIAMGSHPAIVKYNLEKQFPDYQPLLMKSEGFAPPVVMNHSHFLSDDLRKSEHEIFSIQDGLNVEFHITKNNKNVAIVPATIESEHLFIEDLNIPVNFSKSFAGATVEKALSCKVGLILRKDL